MKKYWISIIFIIIIIVAVVVFYKPAPKGTIKIGAVLPLTGVSSIYGQYPREGMELALEEINSNGGIKGKKLEIIYEDSQSQQTIAVTALQELINIHHIPVVLVGASSPETLAEAPVAEKNKVVLLASGSAAPTIRFAGDYIFRLKVSVDKEIDELMKFVYNKLQAKSIYILYVQNDYGEGVKKFSEEIFSRMGGKILGIEGFKIEETDFRSYLAKVKSANPDIIILSGWPKNNGQILKQAEELNIDKTFVSPGGVIGPEITEIAGKSADGLIYTMEFNTRSERRATEFFREKFNKKYGKDPELFASMGYDAVGIIAKLLEKCGIDSTCIKDSLYKIKDYDGATAIISFDEYGDVLKPMSFMTIKDAQLYVPYEE